MTSRRNFLATLAGAVAAAAVAPFSGIAKAYDARTNKCYDLLEWDGDTPIYRINWDEVRIVTLPTPDNLRCCFVGLAESPLPPSEAVPRLKS